jgi:hypothetical protein
LQEKVDSFLEKVALSERGKKADDDDEDIPTEVLLNYPLMYVQRTWLEHRQKGNYPEAGGYNAQDAALMDDWYALDMRMLDIHRELDTEDELMKQSEDNPPPDWRALA